jgi:hypothetical protein
MIKYTATQLPQEIKYQIRIKSKAVVVAHLAQTPCPGYGLASVDL